MRFIIVNPHPNGTFFSGYRCKPNQRLLLFFFFSTLEQKSNKPKLQYCYFWGVTYTPPRQNIADDMLTAYNVNETGRIEIPLNSDRASTV